MRSVIESWEPECWLGHTTPSGGYDWAVIAQQYLEWQPDDFTALGMSLIGSRGNRVPVIVTQSGYVWDGNHRVAACYVLGLPVRFTVMDDSALLVASAAVAEGLIPSG